MTVVRPAQSADLPRLQRIQTAALREPAGELLPAAVDGLLRCFVITDDEPVGYAVVVPGGEATVLSELAVSPDSQGRGYGSTLLRSVCRTLTAEGYHTLRLTASAENDRLYRFYRRHGFETTERLPGYFEHGDAVVFERPLSEERRNDC